MSLLNKASLIQIPSGYKDGTLYSAKPTNGDGDFTFSRGSNLAATRVNSDGLIEKGRENQVLQSNAFDQVEWPLDNATITGGQSGYDGSSDAWLLDSSIAGGNIRQGSSVSGVNTFSIYAKAGTADGIRVRFDQTTDTNVYIDLTDGSVHTAINDITTTTENIGGGWYRVVFSMLNAGVVLFRIYPTDGATNPIAGTIYIQDAQLELGLVATDYIETTTTTAQAGILEDMPRLDYSGGATCGHLLLEPQRSNLVGSSEYVASLAGVTASYVDSPEGFNNATRLTENTATSQHYASIAVGGIVSGQTYALSFYIRKGSYDNVTVYTQSSKMSSTGSITFSTETISVGGAVAGSSFMTPVGNGWYRCGWVGTAITSGSMDIYAPVVNLNSSVGDGTSYTDYYGFQVEDNGAGSGTSYPTSYIPTYGASVTRGADSCSSTALNDTDSPSTYFVEFTTTSVDDEQQVLQLYNSTSGLSLGVTIDFLGTNSGVLGLRAYNLASFGTSSWSGLTANTTYKLAFVIDWTNKTITNAYLNATAADGSVSARIDTTTSALYLGSRVNDYYLSGGVKQFLIFPNALTDDECIQLTTI